MNLSQTLLPLLLGLAACQSSAEGGELPAAEDSKGESTEAEVWETRGVVKRVEPDRGTVTIHHEDVPGYMPSMTMPFWAESPSQLEGLAEGDEVEFSFRRGEGGKHFLVKIEKR